jgi:hypothetical protein
MNCSTSVIPDACLFLHTQSSMFLHSRSSREVLHYGGMPIDHDAIRKRIKERVEERVSAGEDISIRSVSMAAIGSDSALHKFVSGANDSIRLVNIASVADTLGVSLNWLLFGGAPAVQAMPSVEVLEDMVGVAMQKLEDDMSTDQIVRAVATTLREQLEQNPAGVRVRRIRGAEIARAKFAPALVSRRSDEEQGTHTG